MKDALNASVTNWRVDKSETRWTLTFDSMDGTDRWSIVRFNGIPEAVSVDTSALSGEMKLELRGGGRSMEVAAGEQLVMLDDFGDGEIGMLLTARGATHGRVICQLVSSQ